MGAAIWLGRSSPAARASAEISIEIEGFHVLEDERLAVADPNQLPEYFQKDKDPGKHRQRGIEVTSPRGGPCAYVGPPNVEVPKLMGEVVDRLDGGDLDAHVAVRAPMAHPPRRLRAPVRAPMAHLHVVSVHPSATATDGSRGVVQLLVLARKGVLSPEFASIEEYLGATPARTTRPQKVQGGSYQPGRDVAPGCGSAYRPTSSRPAAG